MLNLASLLRESAIRTPTSTACVLGETRLNYAELFGAASKVANGLKSVGLVSGDKVALSCPNLPYFPIVYYGILLAGCTVVPLNVLLKRKEVAYHLEDCDAKAYFCFEGSPGLPIGEEGHAGFSEVDGCKHFFLITANPADASSYEGTLSLGHFMQPQSPACEIAATDEQDTAIILYTSGTTGKPKGAELTHSNMTMNAMVVRDILSYTPEDACLAVLPLFHSFGQTVMMNASILAGAKLVLLPRFDAKSVFGLMETEKISAFAGVPTMYWGLLQSQSAKHFDLEGIAARLRVCISGGAALPLQVLKDFEARFDCPILEGYGLSETSPVASFNQLGQERKPGTIGTPIWGIEMCILDENDQPCAPDTPGEVCIRGHNIMKGYYQRPEENEQALRNGWFHTGDIGTVDEDGYYRIVDRTKDMIIRGGFNVYPREIEEMLVEHEAISMAAVIGIPHPSHGEEIKAFIVLNEGATTSESELSSWAKKRMAKYKCPRHFEIRESLPMNATGKILKRELRNGEGTPSSP